MTKENRLLALQILLFFITILTVTEAGLQWIYSQSFIIETKEGIGFNYALLDEQLKQAIYFSVAFLGILTLHEFGHYFIARYYKIKVTLPYYIPFPFGIGTMGAFIRIKEPVDSRQKFFDIGIAGPLAGFVAAVAILWYGFTHLPPQEYIFTIHPEYQKYGLDYAKHVYNSETNAIYLGNNLLFMFFENFVADPRLVPNHYEAMHYPFLLAGYLACFFTALNLMPIGQLDGGHVLYGLFGAKQHSVISRVLFVVFVFYAGLGIVTPASVVKFNDFGLLLYLVGLYVIFNHTFKGIKNTLLVVLAVATAQFGLAFLAPGMQGYNGWLVFAFVLGQFLGVDHPVATFDRPLDLKRKILGWLALIVFVLCFSPMPLVM